jgi:hypothetical protein
VDCEAGKYVADKQATYCLSCADGYKSTEGQPSCALCVAGFYWGVMKDAADAVFFTDDADLGLYGWGCEVCPDNAVCAEGINEGDLFQPIANTG